MGLVKKRVTPSVVAANRVNSRKSTGPRSVTGKRRAARNAAKRFVFGQVLPARMEEIGEDPEEFERRWHSLRAAVGPRDGFEEMLVEEMAVNRWRLGRLRRAEIGTLWSERMGLLARKLRLEEGRPASDSFGLGPLGLAAAEASPQKFAQILDLLESLRSKVRKEGFTHQGLELLEAIYGSVPDVPGFALIAKFKAQTLSDRGNACAENDDPKFQSGAEGDEQAGWEPASASSPESQEAPLQTSQAVCQFTSDEAVARQDFVEGLNREIETFTKLGIADAMVRKTPMPEPMKDACLIPFKDNLEQILRYETMLQREFERLQKQLRDWRGNQREVRRGRPVERLAHLNTAQCRRC